MDSSAIAAISLPVSALSSAPDTSDTDERKSAPWISYVGLNAAAFFVAEATGVTMPSVNAYLRDHAWSYQAIGIATALAGLGGLLAQTPMGWLIDRIPYRRAALAAASLTVGACFGLLPAAPGSPYWVGLFLLAAGLAKPLFGPLLGGLTLALVGHARLSRVLGINHAFNHLGNIAAALSAMILVGNFGLSSVLFAVLAVSLLAAASVVLIRPTDLAASTAAASRNTSPSPSCGIWPLLHDRRIALLLPSCALFHLANAPVMPLVALHIKHLHGGDHLVPAVVLIAQTVMVPVSLLGGWLSDRIGRKAVFAVAFIVLPLRIFSYSLADRPATLLALQALDGIGAGIFGVLSLAMCGDLTRRTGSFNTLAGIIATASGLGGVAGPLLAGALVEHHEFALAYWVFAGIALAGAVLFLVGVPETRPAPSSPNAILNLAYSVNPDDTALKDAPTA